MYLTTSECFMTEVLECGRADLEMLENVYSTLGEDCYDTDDLISYVKLNGTLNLGSIMEEAYTRIRDSISSKLADLYLDEQLNDTKYYLNDDDNFYILLDEDTRNTIQNLDNDLIQRYMFFNYLDTYFNSDLDKTVDFEQSLEDNVRFLIKHWVKEQGIQSYYDDEDGQRVAVDTTECV